MFRILFLVTLVPFLSHSQFTYEDTLRGSITPERSWWDVLFYEIQLDEVNAENRTISGKVNIEFKCVEGGHRTMQIDLQEPLQIDWVTYKDRDALLLITKIAPNVYHIHLPGELTLHQHETISIHYSGKPIEAKNAPWDGGIVWSKDKNGNDFIATACQGLGASAWWPCKDHGYDEPDNGARISVATPTHLTAISNGQMTGNNIREDQRTTVWEVKNPINLYGINFNIGNYTSWDSIYKGINGDLRMSFYVLPENREKASVQFNDAFRMMEAFEHWFGPYPFYEDGYKLVEVPYLGMEHQSSVTYGNGYQNGYLGTDLSGSGWGLKWDFIIVHESGHEWFANNISCKDNADMWIHESFTSYSEALFTEYFYGKEAGAEYVRGIRSNILNDRPIIGQYDVNDHGSQDMYYKGANMLHTIRQIAGNDEQWTGLLRALNNDFRHQTVTTREIEDYMSNFLGKDLSKVFDQYLRTSRIPKLEMIKMGKTIRYRWNNCVESFDMPVDVMTEKKESIRLYPTTEFQEIKAKKLSIDANYYVF